MIKLANINIHKIKTENELNFEETIKYLEDEKVKLE